MGRSKSQKIILNRSLENLAKIRSQEQLCKDSKSLQKIALTSK
ncbi:hypothetical protein EV11_0921 [Prochlorococcus sp. SS52]|nr:hypothetical protein EV04_0237 [Prochlorococcus marinus str. LG]KGG22042.1 hypothetical protein EV08_0216 [Prochlorococcus marinus str. SS2]KGG24640.1 hypothetical protein EV09_0272 [Prochlorococcus marinus str. SS35]KGG33533.1 hypothetical protein EV10_0742 [Prochlorococcus marinus str. SS51]KGG36230.1 hypothetical protein EV11_0921 [Prochlorococcus sp. SS52]